MIVLSLESSPPLLLLPLEDNTAVDQDQPPTSDGTSSADAVIAELKKVESRLGFSIKISDRIDLLRVLSLTHPLRSKKSQSSIAQRPATTVQGAGTIG